MFYPSNNIAQHMFSILDDVLKLNKGPTYPPCNIIRSVDGDDEILTEITLAVAGFKRDELRVGIDEAHVLTIEGSESLSPSFDYGLNDKDLVYIHRGIASRPFKLAFSLQRGTVVKDVKLNDGLLTIRLTKPIEKVKKPQYLQIE